MRIARFFSCYQHNDSSRIHLNLIVIIWFLLFFTVSVTIAQQRLQKLNERIPNFNFSHNFIKTLGQQDINTDEEINNNNHMTILSRESGWDHIFSANSSKGQKKLETLITHLIYDNSTGPSNRDGVSLKAQKFCDSYVPIATMEPNIMAKIIAPRSPVTLKCQAVADGHSGPGRRQASFLPMRVLWKFNDHLVNEDDGRSLGITVSPNGGFNLHIASYHKRKHSGIYQCILIVPPCGAIVGNPITLTHPTRIPKFRKTIVVRAGQTAIIPCRPPSSNIDGHDIITSYGFNPKIWIKRQKPPWSRTTAPSFSSYHGFHSVSAARTLSEPRNNDRFLDLESGYLLIHEVEPSDSGTYICSAYNTVLDKDQRFGAVKLNVIKPLGDHPSTFSVTSGIRNNSPEALEPVLKIISSIASDDDTSALNGDKLRVISIVKDILVGPYGSEGGSFERINLTLPCSDRYFWFFRDYLKGDNVRSIPKNSGSTFIIKMLNSFSTSPISENLKFRLDSSKNLILTPTESVFPFSGPANFTFFCSSLNLLASGNDIENALTAAIIVKYTVNMVLRPKILKDKASYTIHRIIEEDKNDLENSKFHLTNFIRLRLSCPVEESSIDRAMAKDDAYSLAWFYNGLPITTSPPYSTNTPNIRIYEETNASNYLIQGVGRYDVNIKNHNLSIDFYIDRFKGLVDLLPLNGYYQCLIITPADGAPKSPTLGGFLPAAAPPSSQVFRIKRSDIERILDSPKNVVSRPADLHHYPARVASLLDTSNEIILPDTVFLSKNRPQNTINSDFLHHSTIKSFTAAIATKNTKNGVNFYQSDNIKIIGPNPITSPNLRTDFNLTCKIPNKPALFYGSEIFKAILMSSDGTKNISGRKPTTISNVSSSAHPFVTFTWLKDNKNIRYSNSELWQSGRATLDYEIEKSGVDDNPGFLVANLQIRHARTEDSGRYTCIAIPNPQFIRAALSLTQSGKGIDDKYQHLNATLEKLLSGVKLRKSKLAYVNVIPEVVKDNTTLEKIIIKSTSVQPPNSTTDNSRPILSLWGNDSSNTTTPLNYSVDFVTHATHFDDTGQPAAEEERTVNSINTVITPPATATRNGNGSKSYNKNDDDESFLMGDMFKFTVNQSPNINYDYGGGGEEESIKDSQTAVLIPPNVYQDRKMLLEKLSQASSHRDDGAAEGNVPLQNHMSETTKSVISLLSSASADSAEGHFDYNNVIASTPRDFNSLNSPVLGILSTGSSRPLRKLQKPKVTSAAAVSGGKRKKGDVMVPPNRPNISQISNDSVLVEWTVPVNDGIPILFFKVQYRQLQSMDPEWKTLSDIIPSDTRSFEVRDLFPGALYKFRIAAVYDNYDNRHSINSQRLRLVIKSYFQKSAGNDTALLHVDHVSFNKPKAVLLKEIRIHPPIIIRVWPDTSNSTFRMEWMHRETGLTREQIEATNRAFCSVKGENLNFDTGSFNKSRDGGSSDRLTIGFYVYYRPSGSVSSANYVKSQLIGKKRNLLMDLEKQEHGDGDIYNQLISLTPSSPNPQDSALRGANISLTDLQQPINHPPFHEITRFEVRVSAVLFCLNSPPTPSIDAPANLEEGRGGIPVNVITTSLMSNPKYVDLSKYKKTHEEIDKNHDYLAHPPPKSFQIDPMQHPISIHNNGDLGIPNSILPPLPSSLEDLKKMVIVKDTRTQDNGGREDGGAGLMFKASSSSHMRSLNLPNYKMEEVPVSSTVISSRLFYIVLGNVLAFLLIILFAATLACYCKHRAFVKNYYAAQGSRKREPLNQRLSLLNGNLNSPFKGDNGSVYSPINHHEMINEEEGNRHNKTPKGRFSLFKRYLVPPGTSSKPSTRKSKRAATSSKNKKFLQNVSGGPSYRDLSVDSSCGPRRQEPAGPLMILDLLKNQKRPSSGGVAPLGQYLNFTDTTSFTTHHNRQSFRGGAAPSAISTNGTLNGRRAAAAIHQNNLTSPTTSTAATGAGERNNCDEERQSLLVAMNGTSRLTHESDNYQQYLANLQGLKNANSLNQILRYQQQQQSLIRKRPNSIVLGTGKVTSLLQHHPPIHNYNLLSEQQPQSCDNNFFHSNQNFATADIPVTGTFKRNLQSSVTAVASHSPRDIFQPRGSAAPYYLFPVGGNNHHHLSTLPRTVTRTTTNLPPLSSNFIFRPDNNVLPPYAFNGQDGGNAAPYRPLHTLAEDNILSPTPNPDNLRGGSHRQTGEAPSSIANSSEEFALLSNRSSILTGGAATAGGDLSSRHFSDDRNHNGTQCCSSSSPIEKVFLPKPAPGNNYYYDTFGRKRQHQYRIPDRIDTEADETLQQQAQSSSINYPHHHPLVTKYIATEEDTLEIYSDKPTDFDNGIASFERGNLNNANSSINKTRKFMRTSDRRSSRSNASGSAGGRIKTKSLLRQQRNAETISSKSSGTAIISTISGSPGNKFLSNALHFKSEKNLMKNLVNGVGEPRSMLLLSSHNDISVLRDNDCFKKGVGNGDKSSKLVGNLSLRKAKSDKNLTTLENVTEISSQDNPRQRNNRILPPIVGSKVATKSSPNDRLDLFSESIARSSISNSINFDQSITVPDLNDLETPAPVLTSFKPAVLNQQQSPFKLLNTKPILSHAINNGTDRWNHLISNKHRSRETNSNASSSTSRNNLNNFLTGNTVCESSPYTDFNNNFNGYHVNGATQNYYVPNAIAATNTDNKEILNSSYLSRGSSFNNNNNQHHPLTRKTSATNFKLFDIENDLLTTTPPINNNNNQPRKICGPTDAAVNKLDLRKISDLEDGLDDCYAGDENDDDNFPQIPEFDDANFIENINNLYGQVCSAFNTYSSRRLDEDKNDMEHYLGGNPNPYYLHNQPTQNHLLHHINDGGNIDRQLPFSNGQNKTEYKASRGQIFPVQRDTTRLNPLVIEDDEEYLIKSTFDTFDRSRYILNGEAAHILSTFQSNKPRFPKNYNNQPSFQVLNEKSTLNVHQHEPPQSTTTTRLNVYEELRNVNTSPTRAKAAVGQVSHPNTPHHNLPNGNCINTAVASTIPPNPYFGTDDDENFIKRIDAQEGLSDQGGGIHEKYLETLIDYVTQTPRNRQLSTFLPNVTT